MVVLSESGCLSILVQWWWLLLASDEEAKVSLLFTEE